MLQCPFFLVRYCQVTVGVGMPEAVAWKAAFLPAVTVVFLGWWVILGLLLVTVSLTGLL